MKWSVDYHNDTGTDDEGFWEWWTVSDGTKTFRCDSRKDAEWLADLLNTFSK